MSTRAPLVANLLLALVSGLVALVLCEGIVRVHYAWSRPARLDDLATERPMPAAGSEVGLGDLIQPSPHERLVFELRPGLDVRFTAVQIETNSRGWRDVEHALAAPPNTVRILGIGDSVMFGWGVDREQRYTDLLGAKLSERYPDIQWQTLTLACPGWNLVMEVEALERYGLAFEPDLILYGYVANDTCLPNFVAEEADVWGRESFLWTLLRGLELPSTRLIARDDVVEEHAADAEFALRLCTPESVSERYRPLVGEAAFRDALDRLLAIGAARDIPIVFVSHPLRDEFPHPEVPPDAILVHGIAEPGQPGALAPPDHLRLNRHDPHPNRAGHALIADRLLAALDERGVLDTLRPR